MDEAKFSADKTGVVAPQQEQVSLTDSCHGKIEEQRDETQEEDDVKESSELKLLVTLFLQCDLDIDPKALHLEEKSMLRKSYESFFGNLLGLLASAKDNMGPRALTHEEETVLATLQDVNRTDVEVHAALLQAGRDAETYIVEYMPKQAVSFYERLVDLCHLRNNLQRDESSVRQTQWKFDLAAAMSSLAYARREVGGSDVKKAMGQYTRVHAMLEKHGYTRELAWLLCHMASVNVNDKVLAKRYMDETEEVLGEASVPWNWKAAILTGLGYVAIHLKEFKIAERCFGGALTLRKTNCPNHHSMPRSFSALGYMCRMAGKKEQATEYYSHAIRLFEAQKDMWTCSHHGYSLALYWKGFLLKWAEHPTESEKCLREAIKVGSKHKRYSSFTALFTRTFGGFLMNFRGDNAEAACQFAAALEIYLSPEAGAAFSDAYYTAALLLRAQAKAGLVSKGVDTLARILDMQEDRRFGPSVKVNAGAVVITALNRFKEAVSNAPSAETSRQDQGFVTIKQRAVELGKKMGVKGAGSDDTDSNVLLYYLKVLRIGEYYLLGLASREKGKEADAVSLLQSYGKLKEGFNNPE